MSPRSVRISLRAAAWLFDEVTNFERSFNLDGTGLPRELEELMQAMRRPELKKSWAAYRKSIGAEPTRKAAKATKKATKKTETAAIREAVMRRADGFCEDCGLAGSDGNPLTLDHFFGRVRQKQSEANCWALCLRCHRAKTEYRPDAASWFRAFIVHCVRRGFTAQARLAQDRLEAAALSREAAR